jgi:hypothetical protein
MLVLSRMIELERNMSPLPSLPHSALPRSAPQYSWGPIRRGDATRPCEFLSTVGISRAVDCIDEVNQQEDA